MYVRILLCVWCVGQEGGGGGGGGEGNWVILLQYITSLNLFQKKLLVPIQESHIHSS